MWHGEREPYLRIARARPLLCFDAAAGAGVQKLETVDVIDATDNLIGTADSASQGAVTGRELEAVPAYRPGEILESVPGVVVTQHSGEGKANQTSCVGSISITAQILPSH